MNWRKDKFRHSVKLLRQRNFPHEPELPDQFTEKKHRLLSKIEQWFGLRFDKKYYRLVK